MRTSVKVCCVALGAHSGLRELGLLKAKRLREERLALLAPLAPILERLDLPGTWSALRSGAHLAALTSLTSLNIARAYCLQLFS